MSLRIGTDCSGIEAPIQALIQLGVNIDHSFSCEKDPYALKSIKANYKPRKIYKDITRRDHSLLPDIDIYICGFPCQPFSLIGQKKGTSDTRSNIMKHCISVIKNKTPRVFILENVKNFKYMNNGIPFNYLLNELETTERCNIVHHVLNTKDYGIPQNRERIFIIGILKTIQKKSFEVPGKLPLKKLDNFLLKTRGNMSPNNNCINIINKSNLNPDKNYVIACAGFGNYMWNISRC